MGDEGSGGDFDLCECIMDHQMMMQRLMNWLRQSQGYCTDSECSQNPPGSQAGNGDGGMMMMLMMWTVLAMGLFFLRPASLRRNNSNSNQDEAGIERKQPINDFDGPPPPPPGSAF